MKLRLVFFAILLGFALAAPAGCVVRTGKPGHSHHQVKSKPGHKGKHRHEHCHRKGKKHRVCHSHPHTHSHH